MKTTRVLLTLLLPATLAACDFGGSDDSVPKQSVLEFDGLDDRLTVASAPELDFEGAFTVEAWIYPYDVKNDPGGSERTILRKGYAKMDTTDYRRTTNYHLFFDVRRGSGILGFQGARTPKHTVEKEAWHHVAGVFDPRDSTSTIYVNGERAAEVRGDSIPVPNSDPLTLGLSLMAGGGLQDAYHGLLSEVRIWNKIRTQSQIQTNMRRTMAGDEGGLVAYWKMDDPSGQIIADRAGSYPAILGATEASEESDPSRTKVAYPHFEE